MLCATEDPIGRPQAGWGYKRGRNEHEVRRGYKRESTLRGREMMAASF